MNNGEESGKQGSALLKCPLTSLLCNCGRRESLLTQGWFISRLRGDPEKHPVLMAFICQFRCPGSVHGSEFQRACSSLTLGVPSLQNVSPARKRQDEPLYVGFVHRDCSQCEICSWTPRPQLTFTEQSRIGYADFFPPANFPVINRAQGQPHAWCL